jgi:hypothetical protein
VRSGAATSHVTELLLEPKRLAESPGRRLRVAGREVERAELVADPRLSGLIACCRRELGERSGRRPDLERVRADVNRCRDRRPDPMRFANLHLI